MQGKSYYVSGYVKDYSENIILCRYKISVHNIRTKRRCVNVLNDKQKTAIQMLLEGKTKSDIAKELKMSRTTLYSWINDNEEFSAELNRSREKISREALSELKGDTKKLLAGLEKLALTSDSESIRLQATTALLDRILGKPSTKSEISIDKATESDIELDDIDTLLEEDNAIDNVIELDKAK